MAVDSGCFMESGSEIVSTLPSSIRVRILCRELLLNFTRGARTWVLAGPSAHG